MNKNLRLDFYVVLGIIFASLPFILYFRVRPLTSALFFFVLPTLYLCFRKRKPIKEIIYGTLFLGGTLGISLDILLSANNAWNEITSQLVFPYLLFGFFPADEPFWFILLVLFVIVFYEHFYDRGEWAKLPRKYTYAVVPCFFTLLLIIAVAAFDKTLLLLPYAYVIIASPILIPIVYVLKKRPNLIVKFLKTSAFFFMLYLVYELTAVKLGQWYFTGQYIGIVQIMGIQFPFEELFYWMALSTFGILSLYELFVDDKR